MLVLELTFAVRGFFFILLGYWTDLSDLFSIQALLAAVLVLALIYGGRRLLLAAIAHALGSLTWIAPRGLITVLLFISAREAIPLPKYLGGAVMMVVLVSAALISVGRCQAVGASAGSGTAQRPVKAA